MSFYRVDPTPLTLDQETICIVIDRHTYLLEETAAHTWRLSRRGNWNGRLGTPKSPKPIAVLPHHACGARYPTTITRHTGSHLPADSPPPF